MFSNRDIYNLRAQLRRDALGPLTLIQALIQEFDKGDWMYEMQTNNQYQITHLFFSRGSTQNLLKDNPEVLTMDCTYKTNRFKMPLFVISGQTALNTTFYVAFCFLCTETIEDYIWALNRLKVLYTQLEIPALTVAITDMERGLMSALENVFPSTNHLLCLWHICKNVLAKCKRSFDTKEAWDTFYAAWKSVIYAESESIFDKR